MKQVKLFTFAALLLTFQYKANAQVLESDSLALIDFYNQAGGPNWTNVSGWGEEGVRVGLWTAVTIADGRVTHLNFNSGAQDNKFNMVGTISESVGNLDSLFLFRVTKSPNMTGTLPSSLSQLNKALYVDLRFNEFEGAVPPSYANMTEGTVLLLSGNNFDGLPDMTQAGFASLSITDNQFQFDDIEPNICGSCIGIFQYGNQADVLEEQTFNVVNGESVDLESEIGGTSNVYQWFKDGAMIPGATSATYTIPVLDEAQHAGVYTCEITNTVATALTLDRKPITLNFVSPGVTASDSLALVAFYDAMAGDFWAESTNWKSATEPVRKWVGIEVTGDRVSEIHLSNNNLAGTLPDAIGTLSELTELDISNNSISGAVPDVITNLTQLSDLDVSGNQLDHMPDLGAIAPLVLDMSHNKFTFEDVVPHVGGTFNTTYAPQDSVFEYINTTIVTGTDYLMSSGFDCPGGPCPNAFNTYEWFKDGVAIPLTDAQNYQITDAMDADSGLYHCEITNAFAPALTLIRRTIHVDVSPLTSVSELNEQAEMVAFPNPMTYANVLNWKYEGAFEQGIVALHDGTGRLLLEENVNQPSGDLFVGDLPRGVYYLTLSSNKGLQTLKLVK